MISIGFVAKRTGTSVSAIRYYADCGLIPSSRSASGHRIFPRAVIRRVSFILIAQKMGYSLEQIEVLMAKLPDNRTPTKADWQRLSKSFTKDIDEQIGYLNRLKQKLDGCIGCGCLSLDSCNLYNPDDQIYKKRHWSTICYRR